MPKKTNSHIQGSGSSQKKKSDKVKKDDVKGPRVEDVLNTVGSNDSLLSKHPLRFRLKVAGSRDENSSRGPGDKYLVSMLKGEDTEGQLQSKVGRPNTGFLTTIGLKDVLGNAQGAATDLQHIGISFQGNANNGTPQQLQTPSKSATKSSSKKTPDPRDLEQREKGIADRREELSRKVDKKRSAELVLERSKAAVEFLRSFQLGGDRVQSDRKAAAKRKLIELNRAIERGFIGKPVSNSEPAKVLKDFSEEMSDQLLIPIFQAYATTKWLELRYQNTGPATMDANFKRMEDLISDNPFFNRDILDQDELAELKVLETDFLARTNRAFAAVSLEACEGKHISAAAQERMKLPVTNLALFTFLDEAISRPQQERSDEINRLMQRAAAEMAPLHKIKKLLNELGVTDKNLLDYDLRRLTKRHDPSVEAVLSFYKTADLEKDGTEEALETLKEAVPRQGTFAHKKTLLQNITPTVQAAFEKLNKELDRAKIEIDRQRNSDLREKERAAINALKDVRAKLVDLKTDHKIESSEREGLMSAKLVAAEDLTSIFTEINKNVGEIDQDVVDQNWEDLLRDAIDRELGDPAPTDPVKIHERKIGFLKKLEAKAKEVKEGLVASIDSKLTAQQVARRQELELSRENLRGDFDKIRQKLETLKNPYQESVAQRGGLYSSLGLKSPTLISILDNINGNVGEPNAESVVVDVVGILDDKIEAEKRKASAIDELVQHKGAVAWIESTKTKTAIVNKALQKEIDRRGLEAERELERRRELREEEGRKNQIKEAVAIFLTSQEKALNALSRVHGRLNRLKNAPHDRSLESREELFLPKLSGTNPTFLSVFQNVNAGVEGLQDKQDSDIRGAITRHLNQALKSLDSDSLMTDSSPAAAHEKRMKFLTSAPIYCGDVTTKAGQIEELLKAAELEKLKDLAAASLEPLDAKKRELVVLGVENADDPLKDLPTDGSNAVNDAATNQVKEFYLACDPTGELAGVNAAAKTSVEEALNKLSVDGAFEEVKEFLRAIPEMAKLAAKSLEQAAETKEVFAKVTAELSNNVILIGLAENIAANLVLIHTAKKGLKQPGENLLDDLEELDGEVQGQQAVDLVRQFYKDANVAEDAKNPNEQALDTLKRDVVNSALTFEEKQELLEAIPAVVERAVEMLNKVKEAEEFEELLEAAANSLEPIHAAKKGLKDQDFDWPEDLAPEGDGLDQARAVALVKKFYEEANVEDGAATPKQQALTVLQQGVIEDETLTPEEKKKLLEAVIDVAGRANALLSDAKEVEEKMALENAAIDSLMPIHAVKGELTRIRADNPELLKDLLGDNLLAVDMVRQFYQNLDVSKNAEEQARISLQVALRDLDPTTQRNLIIDVPVIAEEAVTILRKALQQSKEYAKAENLELAAAVEAMNKVREKLIVLKDGHGVSLAVRGELLQRNFRDGDDTDLEDLFHGLNSGVAEIGKSVSVESAAEIIKFAIPLPLEEITQQGKHDLAIEFPEALQIKAAEIEQNLQREIEARKDLKTQERDALKSMDNLYDTMGALESSYGIAAKQRSALFPVNSRYQKYDEMFEELNSSVGGSGDGSARTEATMNSMQVGLKKISPSTTESLSDFYTSVKSRADEINVALERNLLIERAGASRGGGPMSKVDFNDSIFTPIIESDLRGKYVYCLPKEGVTYYRCHPILVGVTPAQQETIGDKFDFVTTKDPEDLSRSGIKNAINALMTSANKTLRVKEYGGRLDEQEMAIAILLAIKHGGIMSDATDSGAVINDLKKVHSFGEEEGEHEKAVALYFRMALFAENFQKLAAKEGFLTGNSYESKSAAKHNKEVKTGLRLKRLPPNYSRDLFVQGGGEIDKWEGICGDIGLTVDVLSRPVGSVSEVGSVSRPLSASNSLASSNGGSRF